MYELLIRIETICVEARPLTLLGVGLVTTVAGLLLWLAGMYFSSVMVRLSGRFADCWLPSCLTSTPC